jgi:hypothetical protein
MPNYPFNSLILDMQPYKHAGLQILDYSNKQGKVTNLSLKFRHQATFISFLKQDKIA